MCVCLLGGGGAGYRGIHVARVLGDNDSAKDAYTTRRHLAVGHRLCSK